MKETLFHIHDTIRIMPANACFFDVFRFSFPLNSDLYKGVALAHKQEGHGCIQGNIQGHYIHLGFQIAPFIVYAYNCKYRYAAPICGERT